MNDLEQEFTKTLTRKILAKRKYQHIDEGLVTSVVRNEAEKGRKKKDTEKAILGKLHQVGAAYFARQPDYQEWASAVSALPVDIHAVETKTLCKEIMKSHYSTEERLPILDDFYGDIFSTIPPISSILDLACGFNPLTLPWMPVDEHIRYFGCDIFSDMIAFLNTFAEHFTIDAKFESCNLLDAKFSQTADIALLLKTATCLEQLQKGAACTLLEAIPADHILISYPNSSLSGRAKGMRENYTKQFLELISPKGWDFEQFEFSSELAFLVKKS